MKIYFKTNTSIKEIAKEYSLNPYIKNIQYIKGYIKIISKYNKLLTNFEIELLNVCLHIINYPKFFITDNHIQICGSIIKSISNKIKERSINKYIIPLEIWNKNKKIRKMDKLLYKKLKNLKINIDEYFIFNIILVFETTFKKYYKIAYETIHNM